MIRIPPEAADLTPVQRFGLAALVDLSRLIPTSDPSVELPAITFDRTGSFGLDRLTIERAFAAAPDRVVVPIGLLDLAGDTIAAGPEQRTDERDRYGRVPSGCNSLVAAGRADEPLVHRLAVELRAAVLERGDRRRFRLFAPWPDGRRWAAALSHDVDVVQRWPVFLGLRLAELARRGEWRRAGAAARAALGVTFGDPVLAAVEGVLERERLVGARSTWFFLAGTPSLGSWARGDVTYRLNDRPAREILGRVRAGGHAIGLHGSLRTSVEPERLRSERDVVARECGAEVRGVRQHFLKLRPGSTHRAMAAAGFAYDASMGFADRNGFRLGVADVVPAWDGDSGQVLPLDLVPLVWMDRAASKYQGIESVDRWIDEAIGLAARCRAVDGLWTGLWHPNLAAPLGFPGAEQGYRRLLDELAAASPWFATMDEIADWRRARRGLIATRWTEAGPIFDSPDLPRDLRLEDAEGRSTPIASR
jgi:hypothetical protein